MIKQKNKLEMKISSFGLYDHETRYFGLFRGMTPVTNSLYVLVFNKRHIAGIICPMCKYNHENRTEISSVMAGICLFQ